VVDLLAQRYGWTIEYIECLDFERFDGHYKLVAKKRIQDRQEELTTEQVSLLTTARAIFFGLQANSDLPPTKAEANRKKPDWSKIEKARKSMMRMMEDYQKALSHPYHFAKHMGLVPAFDKPETEVTPERLRTRKDIEDMRSRMMQRLTAMKEKHGNVDMRSIGQAGQVFEEPEETVQVATPNEAAAEISRSRR
jgi:hypothetical protein